MANESPTSPQLSHGSCRSSEGRMTACPPDQRRPLRRVSDEEVSLAQHVGHDTAVDDRLSWRAADLGAAVERPCTQKRYSGAYERGAGGGVEFDDCNLVNNPDKQLLRPQTNSENLHGLCLEEPAGYQSAYCDDNTFRYPDVSVVPQPGGICPSQKQPQKLALPNQRDRRRRSAYDSDSTVPMASGTNSGATRQPTNNAERHREKLQSLTNQGREFETQLKQIRKKLENFQRSRNDPPRAYSQGSGREVCTQNEGLDAECSQVRTCSKQMRGSGRPISEAKVDSEVSQQLSEARKSQSVRDKVGKFYQCDSDVSIKCVAGNRYGQLSCERSSDSTGSGSDDNEHDVRLRDSRRRYQADRNNSKLDSDRHTRRRTVTRTPPRRVSYRDRNEHQSRDRSNWIKPEKFNGHGSFETFLVQFENCAS